jgi:hypothetical protein
VECVKGRFFDRTAGKLNQLARFGSNELVPADSGPWLPRYVRQKLSGENQIQPEHLIG